MKQDLPLSQKLTVLYRIEPGCLGPQGKQYIEGFCTMALATIGKTDNSFIRWIIVPRYDKSLPEVQYLVNDKALNREMANRYLMHFGRELEPFENTLYEKLADLIDEYMQDQNRSLP